MVGIYFNIQPDKIHSSQFWIIKRASATRPGLRDEQVVLVPKVGILCFIECKHIYIVLGLDTMVQQFSSYNFKRNVHFTRLPCYFPSQELIILTALHLAAYDLNFRILYSTSLYYSPLRTSHRRNCGAIYKRDFQVTVVCPVK